MVAEAAKHSIKAATRRTVTVMLDLVATAEQILVVVAATVAAITELADLV
jgi:hypothetical protein